MSKATRVSARMIEKDKNYTTKNRRGKPHGLDFRSNNGMASRQHCSKRPLNRLVPGDLECKSLSSVLGYILDRIRQRAQHMTTPYSLHQEAADMYVYIRKSFSQTFLCIVHHHRPRFLEPVPFPA